MIVDGEHILLLAVIFGAFYGLLLAAGYFATQRERKAQHRALEAHRAEELADGVGYDLIQQELDALDAKTPGDTPSL
jgi:hypothetical protein